MDNSDILGGFDKEQLQVKPYRGAAFDIVSNCVYTFPYLLTQGSTGAPPPYTKLHSLVKAKYETILYIYQLQTNSS